MDCPHESRLMLPLGVMPDFSKMPMCRADALTSLLGDTSETVDPEAKDAAGKTKGVGLRSLLSQQVTIPACLQITACAPAHHKTPEIPKASGVANLKLLMLQLHANALQYVGDPEAPRTPWKGLHWRELLRPMWRQDDRESIFCYVLFMAVFVADYSVLAMVFPVVLYIYALLAQTPATRFWQASLFVDCTLAQIILKQSLSA